MENVDGETRCVVWTSDHFNFRDRCRYGQWCKQSRRESLHSEESEPQLEESCHRGEPKELFIVPGAGHVDLYDRVDLIPFDKLTAFFREHLDSSVRAAAAKERR